MRQLTGFFPASLRYAWERNAVRHGHPAVSRLSPAIRHRLVTEDEVAAVVLGAHPLERVEKFIQEVYWRRYWKSWLSLRPELWTDYLESLETLYQNGGREVIGRIERAESGNAVIDHFARELVETGYLHNHARMWFAAWWIHEARLPWELGAAFFYKHLLDGDPASNTLSWRWVAGLQTAGKTYLARRANLEKYLSAELLESLKDGLPAFENPSPFPPSAPVDYPVTQPVLQASHLEHGSATGLWIHEEDLAPENSPLGFLTFQSVVVTGHASAWSRLDFPAAKQAWLRSALGDAAARAEAHWKTNASLEYAPDLAARLVAWARGRGISQIATLRPDVGMLGSTVPALTAELAAAGIHLAMADRPRDIELRPLATGGFFRFWETMVKRGLLPRGCEAGPVTASRKPTGAATAARSGS